MDQNSKGKIFFFGPNSSLKFNFPIRTNKTAAPAPADSDKNEEKSVNNKHEHEKRDGAEEVVVKDQKNAAAAAATEPASDEDSEDLLKKIDAALEGENGVEENDSSKADESVSVNSKATSNDNDEAAQESALEANSEPESCSAPPADAPAASDSKHDDESNRELNKCESVNLSSECDNDDSAKNIRVEKIVETEKAKTEMVDERSHVEVEVEKPIEIEPIKEPSSSNVAAVVDVPNKSDDERQNEEAIANASVCIEETPPPSPVVPPTPPAEVDADVVDEAATVSMQSIALRSDNLSESVIVNEEKVSDENASVDAAPSTNVETETKPDEIVNEEPTAKESKIQDLSEEEEEEEENLIVAKENEKDTEQSVEPENMSAEMTPSEEEASSQEISPSENEPTHPQSKQEEEIEEEANEPTKPSPEVQDEVPITRSESEPQEIETECAQVKEPPAADEPSSEISENIPAQNTEFVQEVEEPKSPIKDSPQSNELPSPVEEEDAQLEPLEVENDKINEPEPSVSHAVVESTQETAADEEVKIFETPADVVDETRRKKTDETANEVSEIKSDVAEKINEIVEGTHDEKITPQEEISTPQSLTHEQTNESVDEECKVETSASRQSLSPSVEEYAEDPAEEQCVIATPESPMEVSESMAAEEESKTEIANATPASPHEPTDEILPEEPLTEPETTITSLKEDLRDDTGEILQEESEEAAMEICEATPPIVSQDTNPQPHEYQQEELAVEAESEVKSDEPAAMEDIASAQDEPTSPDEQMQADEQVPEEPPPAVTAPTLESETPISTDQPQQEQTSPEVSQIENSRAMLDLDRDDSVHDDQCRVQISKDNETRLDEEISEVEQSDSASSKELEESEAVEIEASAEVEEPREHLQEMQQKTPVVESDVSTSDIVAPIVEEDATSPQVDAATPIEETAPVIEDAPSPLADAETPLEEAPPVIEEDATSPQADVVTPIEEAKEETRAEKEKPVVEETSDIESEDDFNDDNYEGDIPSSPEQTESEPRDKTPSPLPLAVDEPKIEEAKEEEEEECVLRVSVSKEPSEIAAQRAVEEQSIPADDSIINERVDLKIEQNSEAAKAEAEQEEEAMPEPPVEIVEAGKADSEVLQAAASTDVNFNEENTSVETIAAPIEVKNELPQVKEQTPKQEFQKPPQVTRKRKLSERKSISESDSDGGSNFITDSAVSNDNHSDEEEEEEAVVSKKPRIRGKVVATRNTRATRQSMKAAEETTVAVVEKVKVKEEEEVKQASTTAEEKTLQNLKFDYDENEDIAANVAAIKTLICKDPPKQESEKSSDEETSKKKTHKRKSKRGRAVKKNDARASSSEEDEGDASKGTKTPESKRTKTSEESAEKQQEKKKRESGGRGLLKYIDTSLVIETVETEAPIRQSRRIAQQKIKEENDRRLMEERLLKQMKEDAERKKKEVVPDADDDHENDRSSDESYKGSKRKKKKKEKLKPSDKPWQTSSSHSEHTESEDDFEHPHSEDPGSPLFKSDHEFSPESDVDDATAPPQPVKRARTAKKQVEESSDDEDVNPNHACQVCHKTDSPEWILLCDECDHGYHCSCLKPIIFCIPSGNWYCPLCCHKKLIDNLSTQLEKLDTLVHEIQAEEIRVQKQLELKKLTEITEENILKERRKNRPELNRKRESSRDDESSEQESGSNDDGSSSDNSSDNAPLIYKLRRRNQTSTTYRFNDYDELINSAIRDEMEEVKGMGNAGRGKDISTIIEADKEEKKMQKLEKERAAAGDEKGEGEDDDDQEQNDDQDGAESSESEIVRTKKSIQKKKKNRKLNNLEDTSEEDNDEDFRDSSSSDSEEDYSMSSVSESSLDLPLKKGGKAAKRSTRSAAKNRRYDENFINDNTSDDEPLIKKRTKKLVDSDEESFDANEDGDNSDGSTADEIDSDDLCDDTETDSSSEGNWPKKKKKRVASYDVKKPRKPAKKDDDSDKAFRAGISKKKILKKSENESEASEDEKVKGKRRTRGKKLLYLIEDDYESDDGIKPGIGVVRPETPPEEREMFVKKQEEIKRMLAAKNTEGARQLAMPTIEPIKLSLEQPKSPSLPPVNESASSLSTIPKNVIESAKALDMDYNRLKPLQFGIHAKSSGEGGSLAGQDMSEEELARMMEEEDFAQHQLRLAGEAIARSNKLLELEGKEEAFAQFSKKLKEEKPPTLVATAATPLVAAPPSQDPKKRARKPKTEKILSEHAPAAPAVAAAAAAPVPSSPTATTKSLETAPHPAMSLPPPHILRPQIPADVLPKQPPLHGAIPSIPPLIPNTSHPPFANLPPRYVNPNQPLPPHIQDRPSVLSNYLPRHELIPPQHQSTLPPHMRFMSHQQLQATQDAFALKVPPSMPHHPPPHHAPSSQAQQQPLPPQPPVAEEVEEKKKGRRKKFTPLRTDLPESKVAKLDTPASSVIQHATLNLAASDRNAAADDKSKGMTPQQRAKTITAIANAPTPFGAPVTNPTPSVITRLLQPQQRNPYGGGFVEQMAGGTPSSPSSAAGQQPPPTSRAFPDDPKHIPASKQARPSANPAALGQPPFNEHTFVPRSMHPLYRGPPTSQPSIYGLPHARIPYPFHHLHPNSNLRPNMQEYAAPYNLPAQFGYYAPPAHGRHPTNPAAAAAAPPPLGHVIPSPPTHPNDPNSAPSRNPSDEAPGESSTSEFGGLVSYFSSQQELD